jgi:hypothetical protein
VTVPGAGAGERGVGIMEVVVATVIAVIAIVALAYSFGAGRGLVDEYEAARVALAAAQRRVEMLGRHPAGSGMYPVQVDGQTVVLESWQVDAFDDPANGTSAGSVDLKKVTVSVSWGQLRPGETVSLTRLFPTH